MSVTIEQIKLAKKKAKQTGKPIKISLGKSLRLNVTKDSATFQFRYYLKVDGKRVERLDTFDTVIARTNPNLIKAISKAFDDADEDRILVKQGIDPVLHKKNQKTQNTENQLFTFDKTFLTWIDKISKAAEWSIKHKKDMASKYNKYISPRIGGLPIESITLQNISDLLEDLEDSPATYRKVRGLLNMLLKDSTTKGKIKSNPMPSEVVQSVEKYIPRNLPAITNLSQLHNIIAGINRLKIAPEVREASLLQAHTALRSQTVVAARWCEFDLTNKLWRIPRVKGRIKLHDAKKHGEYYTVPLSNEVVSQLTRWRETLRWQKSDLLFPSNSKAGHITIDAIRKVYKNRLKIDSHCAHGWRSSFSTLAHDAVDDDRKALFRTDVIERCLDHVFGNKVTQAYNRGELLDLRAQLMSWWSKELSNSNVTEIGKVKTS